MATGDLITLEQAGNFLNLPEAQYDADPNLPGMISAFSQFLLTLIGRNNILPASYTERRDGNGNDTIGTMNAPIISVASVTIDGAAAPVSSGYPAPGYWFDENTIRLVGGGVGFPWSPNGFPGRFTRGRGNVSLVYEAGYAATPLDIEQAVIEMVAWAYKYKDRFGLSSQTTPQVFVNAYSQQPLSPMAQLLVKKYKKKAAQW
jgi:hypothetical protein